MTHGNFYFLNELEKTRLIKVDEDQPSSEIAALTSWNGAAEARLPPAKGQEKSALEKVAIVQKHTNKKTQLSEKAAKIEHNEKCLKFLTKNLNAENVKAQSHEKEAIDAEQELEVATQLHKLCSQCESKMEKKEKLDFKYKKQGKLGLCLLSEESNDKIKMNTPEMSSASENSVKMEKTAEGLCCSCSKNSLCKTNKCRCRSSGGSCGASCGCKRFKCTNREPNQLEGNEPLKSDNTECTLEASAEDKDGSV
ncbi:hypothetical protein JHK85_009781 [Glycine max]|nr:hypothetical protein JHK85_009781 [Glycine max]